MVAARTSATARLGRAATVALTLAGLLACGDRMPEGTAEIQEYSQVGDCLKPDPDISDGFLQAGCEDDAATVKIIEMVSSLEMEAPVCPAGTDVLVDGQQGPIVDGDIAATSQTWCLRNLDPPHPGDPGMGGGELVVQDCFAVTTTGAIDEAACDGGEGAEHRLLAIVQAIEGCPPETVEPIEVTSFPVRVYCAGPL